MIAGVTSGYYIFEPLIREHEVERRAREAELEAVAEAAQEPVAEVRRQMTGDGGDAPVTRWLFFRR